MKMVSQEMEDQLLRYLDGELNATESKVIERKIMMSSDVSTRLEELRLVRSFLMNRARVEAPSKNFTQKVMNDLDVLPARSTASFRNGLLILIGSILVSVIALVLLSAGVFDSTTTQFVVGSPLKNNWFAFPSLRIPFNGKMFVNGIVFLNLALAFVLLDRTVLKPLFQKRTFFEY
ncbi:MAG: hypothetical protein IM574_12950 [Cytophagales bacterium]|jgi:hypothetical protein|nr:hypothetical protein [Cytophagales bacterium]MCA6386438.1 hypothetical protein [Cytophagales bacterium]MCA6390052.1 hypothetical protein [Cytophagales bacterium]MCA6393844.1 hypothetical protein [Cytophagales bacterium]MCA6397313.1 hypothetical protein [Cytophagales bacterium]